MSRNPSMTLPLLVALGAGALLGLSAASQREKLPAIGGPKPSLEGAQPLPLVEIALGVELAEAGGRVRHHVEQVPQAIRESLGFAPSHLGFKEDVSLAPRAYAVRLRGLVVASGHVDPDRLLAIRTLGGGEGGDLPGEAGVEPVTGRTGVWISEEDAGRARLFGYDVLDPELVFALHVDAALRRHLHELLTREETYRMLERVRQTAPRTVEDLTAQLEVGLIQKVLQNLLREHVSLRDLPLVLELVADAARTAKEPAALTEAVRTGLARQLSAAFADASGVLHAIPMGPRWEQIRHAKSGDRDLGELIEWLRSQARDAREQGFKPVLVAPSDLRLHVRQLIERPLPDLPVLAEHEVDAAFTVQALTGETVRA